MKNMWLGFFDTENRYERLTQLGDPLERLNGAINWDEGISGTSTRYRDGFNQMVKDALDGKIGIFSSKINKH